MEKGRHHRGGRTIYIYQCPSYTGSPEGEGGRKGGTLSSLLRIKAALWLTLLLSGLCDPDVTGAFVRWRWIGTLSPFAPHRDIQDTGTLTLSPYTDTEIYGSLLWPLDSVKKDRCCCHGRFIGYSQRNTYPKNKTQNNTLIMVHYKLILNTNLPLLIRYL